MSNAKDINAFKKALPRGVGSLKKKMWYELSELDRSKDFIFLFLFS
jgi:hypothetical protein